MNVSTSISLAENESEDRKRHVSREVCSVGAPGHLYLPDRLPHRPFPPQTLCVYQSALSMALQPHPLQTVVDCYQTVPSPIRLH